MKGLPLLLFCCLPVCTYIHYCCDVFWLNKSAGVGLPFLNSSCHHGLKYFQKKEFFVKPCQVKHQVKRIHSVLRLGFSFSLNGTINLDGRPVSWLKLNQTTHILKVIDPFEKFRNGCQLAHHSALSFSSMT